MTLGHGSLECLRGQPRGYPWQAHLNAPVLTNRVILLCHNIIYLLAMMMVITTFTYPTYCDQTRESTTSSSRPLPRRARRPSCPT